MHCDHTDVSKQRFFSFLTEKKVKLSSNSQLFTIPLVAMGHADIEGYPVNVLLFIGEGPTPSYGIAPPPTTYAGDDDDDDDDDAYKNACNGGELRLKPAPTILPQPLST